MPNVPDSERQAPTGSRKRVAFYVSSNLLADDPRNASAPVTAAVLHALNQAIEIGRYCERHDLDVVGPYADLKAHPLTPLADRPGGRRLLDDAEIGEFSAVVVYSLGRLAGSRDLLAEVTNRLSGLGISILAVHESMGDVDRPTII